MSGPIRGRSEDSSAEINACAILLHQRPPAGRGGRPAGQPKGTIPPLPYAAFRTPARNGFAGSRDKSASASGAVLPSKAKTRLEILPPPASSPRWGVGGAATMLRRTEWRVSMSKPPKSPSTVSEVPASAAKPSPKTTAEPKGKKTDPGSKQSRVVACYGCTVAPQSPLARRSISEPPTPDASPELSEWSWMALVHVRRR